MMRFLYTSIYSLTRNPPEDTCVYLGRYSSSTVPTLESHIVTSCPLYKPFYFFKDKKERNRVTECGTGQEHFGIGEP